MKEISSKDIKEEIRKVRQEIKKERAKAGNTLVFIYFDGHAGHEGYGTFGIDG